MAKVIYLVCIGLALFVIHCPAAKIDPANDPTAFSDGLDWTSNSKAATRVPGNTPSKSFGSGSGLTLRVNDVRTITPSSNIISANSYGSPNTSFNIKAGDRIEIDIESLGPESIAIIYFKVQGATHYYRIDYAPAVVLTTLKFLIPENSLSGSIKFIIFGVGDGGSGSNDVEIEFNVVGEGDSAPATMTVPIETSTTITMTSTTASTTTVSTQTTSTTMTTTASTQTTTTTVIIPTLYISNLGSDSTGDGSMGNPYATISYALAIGSGVGTNSVLVADGTYDITSNINLIEGISLFGGHDPITWTRDLNLYTSTIRDVGAASPVPIIASSGITNATILDGFTIVAQVITTSTQGIYLSLGSPTISNNIIIVDGAGNGTHSGISVNQGSALIYNNKIIVLNTRYAYGISLYNSTAIVYNNVVDTSDNGINFNGAITFSNGGAPIIRNNTVYFGNASPYGCGICTDTLTTSSAITPSIDNNIIYAPATATNGIGIHIKYSNQSPISLNNNNIFDCQNALYKDEEATVAYTLIADVNTNLGFANNNLSFDLADGVNTYFINEGIDFHLQNGGVAGFMAVKAGGIDGGASWGFTADHDGNARTGNGTDGWSIGAYENDL